MQNAALIAWAATVGGGLTMLAIWLAKGGLRQVDDPPVPTSAQTVAGAGAQPGAGAIPATTATARPRSKLELWKLGTHAAMALLGGALLIAYVLQDDRQATGWDAAPWLIVGALVLAAGFGASMAVPWYRERRARRSATPGRRKPAEQSIPLPVAALHGLAAAATIVLVVLVALDFG